MMKVNQNVSFIYTDVVALTQRAQLDSVCYSLLTRGQFSTGRNTTNSKNTTYFWFGCDNKPRGFLLSNIIFIFMALACIFFYCMPLSTDEEPFLLHGQLNIAISATRQLQLSFFRRACHVCNLGLDEPRFTYRLQNSFRLWTVCNVNQ